MIYWKGLTEDSGIPTEDRFLEFVHWRAVKFYAACYLLWTADFSNFNVGIYFGYISGRILNYGFEHANLLVLTSGSWHALTLNAACIKF